ncbi:hypothetical protein BGX38DRAFT_1211115 [Terfezia claveryi]|nr:hypothetical protein BGX38DRAFT_1211115 [Terfezia claveryi]
MEVRPGEPQLVLVKDQEQKPQNPNPLQTIRISWKACLPIAVLPNHIAKLPLQPWPSPRNWWQTFLNKVCHLRLIPNLIIHILLPHHPC